MDEKYDFIHEYFILQNDTAKKVECDEIAFSEGTIIENEFCDNHVQNNSMMKMLKNIETSIIKLSDRIDRLEQQQKTMIEFMVTHQTQIVSSLDKYQK